MISNIIWGFGGIFLAFLLVKYRRSIIHFTGKWGWAEKYLGIGGSYSAVVIVAIIVFLLALSKLFGKIDNIFKSSLGRFFY